MSQPIVFLANTLYLVPTLPKLHLQFLSVHLPTVLRSHKSINLTHQCIVTFIEVVVPQRLRNRSWTLAVRAWTVMTESADAELYTVFLALHKPWGTRKIDPY